MKFICVRRYLIFCPPYLINRSSFTKPINITKQSHVHNYESQQKYQQMNDRNMLHRSERYIRDTTNQLRWPRDRQARATDRVLLVHSDTFQLAINMQ